MTTVVHSFTEESLKSTVPKWVPLFESVVLNLSYSWDPRENLRIKQTNTPDQQALPQALGFQKKGRICILKKTLADCRPQYFLTVPFHFLWQHAWNEISVNTFLKLRWGGTIPSKGKQMKIFPINIAWQMKYDPRIQQLKDDGGIFYGIGFGLCFLLTLHTPVSPTHRFLSIKINFWWYGVLSIIQDFIINFVLSETLHKRLKASS